MNTTQVECKWAICSCGTVFDFFKFWCDPRGASADPADWAEARSEYDGWIASISCSICGKPGVLAEDEAAWGEER
jgi:hypothetical protein